MAETPKSTPIPKGTTVEELATEIAKDIAKSGTGKGRESELVGEIVSKSINKVLIKKNRIGKSSRGVVRYKPDKGTQQASDRPLMSAMAQADTTPGQQDLSGKPTEKSKPVTT